MRLLVLGGGPAGMNAALQARELNTPITIRRSHLEISARKMLALWTGTPTGGDIASVCSLLRRSVLAASDRRAKYLCAKPIH